MIIGLSGKAGSGKDTVGDFMTEYGYIPYAFADPIKQLAMSIDPWVRWGPEGGVEWTRLSNLINRAGWRHAKSFIDVRSFLQDLGQGIREYDETFWIDRLRDSLPEGRDIVITDVRYPNEMNMIRMLGGQIWHIMRPDNETVVGEAAEHPSEMLHETFIPDVTIENVSTLHDLHSKVESLMTEGPG